MCLDFDVRVDLTTSPSSIFSGSYIHAIYNECTTESETLIIDLYLPRMGNVLSPLHDLNNSNNQYSTWIPTPNSIRLYPSPTVGESSLIDYLSNTSLTAIIDMIGRVIVDAYPI